MATRGAGGALGKLVISLRSSFWFLPVLIVLASVGLAVGMVAIDAQTGGGLGKRWPKLFAVDADGARELMATIAGSMMTVAGVVFSITIVALAQAATQYTSRVLRTFMRDRRNQVVLGVFLGVFAYCVGVLRSITTDGGDGFVPHLAVFVGLVLVLVAVVFLALYIHHVAAQIQSGAIARGIARDTLETIDDLFPDALEGDEAPPARDVSDVHWHAVRAPQMGYIERVDPDALLRFAREHDVVVRMERNVGDFVSPDRTIASIAAVRTPDAGAMRDLSRLFAVDSYRSIEQDIAFGLRQLVDVALKALSPGINDTTTAITSLDYLSVILERLAGRRIEPRPLCDGDTVRVMPMGLGFERLLALGMDQILENAHGNTVVQLRMLQAIEQIRAGTRSPARHRMLDAKRDVIAEVARCTASSIEARRLIEKQLAGADAAEDDASGA